MKRFILAALLVFGFVSTVQAEEEKGFLSARNVGVGVGGSFIDRDNDADFDHSLKLDMNVGGLYANYYTKVLVGGGFMPVFPIVGDRLGAGIGIGLFYRKHDDIKAMYVHMPVALDLRVIGRLHARFGPNWFIPTNAGSDVNGLDSDNRREAWKRPRYDLSARWQF